MDADVEVDDDAYDPEVDADYEEDNLYLVMQENATLRARVESMESQFATLTESINALTRQQMAAAAAGRARRGVASGAAGAPAATGGATSAPAATGGATQAVNNAMQSSLAAAGGVGYVITLTPPPTLRHASVAAHIDEWFREVELFFDRTRVTSDAVKVHQAVTYLDSDLRLWWESHAKEHL